MPRPASIRSTRDFRSVFSGGRRAGAHGLVVHVQDRRDGAPPRLGLAVRGPGAVDRNRVKRRLRAAFATCPPMPGLDVVVRLDARTREQNFQKLSERLCELIQEAAS